MPAPGNFGQLLGLGGGSPDVNYDQINALLQQFGGLSVSPPRPIGLAESTGWGQQHPGLSGGIDNALITLANMGQPSMSIGGNISNVARGLQSIGPTRAAQSAAQLMLPLQAAGEVAKLRGAQANIEREGAMAKYYGSRNDTAEAVADRRALASEHNADRRAEASVQGRAIAAAKDPLLMKDGTVGLPEWDDDTQSMKIVSHPEIDPKSVKHSQLQKLLGGGAEGAIIIGKLGGDPESYQRRNPMLGKVGAKGSAAFWDDADKIYSGHRAIGPGINQSGADVRQDKATWNSAQGTLFKNLMDDHAKSSESRVTARAQEILFSQPKGSADPSKAMAQAQQEEDNRKGQIMGAKGEFDMLDPEEQMGRGGIMGFISSKGYDVATHTFKAVPTRTGAAVPQPQKTAPSSAVSKFLDLLRNPE